MSSSNVVHNFTNEKFRTQIHKPLQDINFELGAVTVDPQTSAYDPSPLKGYLKQLNVPYYYEEQSKLFWMKIQLNSRSAASLHDGHSTCVRIFALLSDQSGKAIFSFLYRRYFGSGVKYTSGFNMQLLQQNEARKNIPCCSKRKFQCSCYGPAP